MGLRDRVGRLERDARGQGVEIPQRGGTVARFPPSAPHDAYVNLMERLGAGGGAPPEHPLLAAARNSSDPEWSGSIFATDQGEAWTGPVEDLSE